MSLMERVREAGGAGASRAASAPRQLDELKRRVQDVLPPHVIAQMKEESPKRAENEVRMACDRVLAVDPWLAEGGAGRAALVDELVASLFGMGPLEWMLADESITEVMVNGTASLYVERNGRLEPQPCPFVDDDEVRAIIDRIIGPLGRRIDEASPTVNARLAQGHRVHAIIPPLALDGPVLTIRKFRANVMSLAEMVQGGSVEPRLAVFLRWCVRARKNLAVSGGTGSGKTTLLNALSCEIDHGERILTIEDSAELRFHEHPHVVRLEARPPSAEGAGEVTIRDLVVNALRMRPDRIIVGECRSGEALDMLQAMNTGHDGSLTTLHANSPQDCIMRLTTLVRYAADLPVDVIGQQIGSALDCIVQVTRDAGGVRFVSEVDEVLADSDGRGCRTVTMYERKRSDQAGVWHGVPAWVDPRTCEGWARAWEVESWLQQLPMAC